MDPPNEIERKAKEHGGWIERIILGLLGEIERLENMTTYAKRVDGNQTQIVEALRQVGASVEHLHTVGGGVPDLLCGRSSPCPCCGSHFPQTYLIEVKVEGRHLNARQRNWRAAWRGQLAVVRTMEEALVAVGATHV